MVDALATAISEASALTGLELLAVILAVIYLLLAVRENQWCWPAAFVSTAIYVYVFHEVYLFLEAGLQLFYMAMAVYGWWSWRQGNANDILPVTTWRWQQHAMAMGLVATLVIVSGYLLKDTAARLPYIDAFTTWGSVITTWMVTRKILENWIYWFVIDAVSIYLYLDRELYFTALLFVIYLVIIVFGYVSWRRSLGGVESVPAGS